MPPRELTQCVLGVGLAIVPLYGILEGKPAVKDLDLNQSLALSLTGLVWTYYGFLVVPRYVHPFSPPSACPFHAPGACTRCVVALDHQSL